MNHPCGLPLTNMMFALEHFALKALHPAGCLPLRLPAAEPYAVSAAS